MVESSNPPSHQELVVIEEVEQSSLQTSGTTISFYPVDSHFIPPICRALVILIENSKVSGFLPIEREWIDKFISHGYEDTFRIFNREPNQYTWWDMKSGARARNVGWRIDYFYVSEDLLVSLTGAFIMPDIMGSDHCPIGITLNV